MKLLYCMVNDQGSSYIQMTSAGNDHISHSFTWRQSYLYQNQYHAPWQNVLEVINTECKIPAAPSLARRKWNIFIARRNNDQFRTHDYERVKKMWWWTVSPTGHIGSKDVRILRKYQKAIWDNMEKRIKIICISMHAWIAWPYCHQSNKSNPRKCRTIYCVRFEFLVFKQRVQFEQKIPLWSIKTLLATLPALNTDINVHRLKGKTDYATMTVYISSNRHIDLCTDHNIHTLWWPSWQYSDCIRITVNITTVNAAQLLYGSDLYGNHLLLT